MEEEIVNEPIEQSVTEDSIDEVQDIEVSDEQESISVDETEEVDFGGKKYVIPKELKGALMATDDYTRKSQEVAEQRRQIEARAAEFEKQRQVHEANTQERAKLFSVEEQLKHFEGVDWKTLTENDPIQAQQLFITYNQLRDAKNGLTQSIQQREHEQSTLAQQATAKAVADGQAVLQRDIKGWSPDLAGKLGNFAVEKFGFDKEAVSQIYDPRVVKLLHAAYIGDQIINKGKSKPDNVTDIKPVQRVAGGKATPVKDPGKMSDSEYQAWRRKAKR